MGHFNHKLPQHQPRDMSWWRWPLAFSYKALKKANGKYTAAFVLYKSLFFVLNQNCSLLILAERQLFRYGSAKAH